MDVGWENVKTMKKSAERLGATTLNLTTLTIMTLSQNNNARDSQRQDIQLSAQHNNTNYTRLNDPQHFSLREILRKIFPIVFSLC